MPANAKVARAEGHSIWRAIGAGRTGLTVIQAAGAYPGALGFLCAGLAVVWTADAGILALTGGSTRRAHRHRLPLAASGAGRVAVLGEVASGARPQPAAPGRRHAEILPGAVGQCEAVAILRNRSALALPGVTHRETAAGAVAVARTGGRAGLIADGAVEGDRTALRR